MARPREFELDDVLDKALEAFWMRGYESTSMADLTEAMGLKKGSIYAAFGDKHSLFLAALTRYTDMHFRRFQEVFEQAETPRDGLESFLGGALVDYATGGETRKGCFVVNSLVELGPHDPAVNEILRRQYARIEALFRKNIGEGQAMGQFRTDVSEEDLATAISVIMSGIMTDCKSGRSEKGIRRIAATFLTTIAT